MREKFFVHAGVTQNVIVAWKNGDVHVRIRMTEPLAPRSNKAFYRFLVTGFAVVGFVKVQGATIKTRNHVPVRYDESALRHSLALITEAEPRSSRLSRRLTIACHNSNRCKKYSFVIGQTDWPFRVYSPLYPALFFFEDAIKINISRGLIYVIMQANNEPFYSKI